MGGKEIKNYDDFIACFESVPLDRRDDAILAALRGINAAIDRAHADGVPVRVNVEIYTDHNAVTTETEQ